jgi:hypothetical protein
LSAADGVMVFIPTAVLVALALANPAKGKTSAVAGLMSVAVAILGLMLVRASLPDEMIWPNSEVMRRCRWLVKHLEGKPGWESAPVVILTGSSATMFSLDPSRIERRLEEEGKPATVLPICISGATLCERRYMLQSFLQMVGADARRKLSGANILLLGEVFDSYDQNPLYRMEKEAFSERLIQFLNAGNAWKAWQAYLWQREMEPGLPLFLPASLLAQHALLNALAVGALSDMQLGSGKKRKTESFFALEGKKGNFDYNQALRSLENARSMPRDFSLPLPQAKLGLEQMLEPLQSYPHRLGYYSLPMLEPHRTAYAAALHRSLPGSIFIGPPARSDLEAMLAEDCWFDGVHPTSKGAALFSEWFAVQLAKTL